MHKQVLASILGILMAVTACGDDAKDNATAGSDGGSGSGGKEDGGASGSKEDGGASGNGSDAGPQTDGGVLDGSMLEDASGGPDAAAIDSSVAACTNVDPSPNEISEMQQNTVFPTPGGGVALQNGTYYLTHYDVYFPSTASSTKRRRLMKVDGNKLTLVVAEADVVVPDNVGTFVINDKNIDFTITCPYEGTVMLPFTASPTQIQIFNGTTSVATFTKQ